MARYEVAPTKTNFLEIKRQLSFASQGSDLLKQKKDILTAELMSFLDKAKDIQMRIDDCCKESFGFLVKTKTVLGTENLREIANNSPLKSSVRISFRKTMGVNLPKVEVGVSKQELFYGVNDTTMYLDETVKSFQNLLQEIGSFAEIKISVMKLAKEVRKTIQRVNALDKIYIPDHDETLKYIQGALEESERETFFVLKTLKKRMQKQ